MKQEFRQKTLEAQSFLRNSMNRMAELERMRARTEGQRQARREAYATYWANFRAAHEFLRSQDQRLRVLYKPAPAERQRPRVRV